MSDGLKYNENPNAAEVLLQSKKMDLESGYLGKFFGAPTHSPLNIAGLLIFILIIPSIVLLFTHTIKESLDYLVIILPIVTLALGYLFGKNT